MWLCQGGYLPKGFLLYFQANASRWLCNKAWGCRLILQWHASWRQHKLWLQLQEEVSLPVAPADLHLVLHSLHPIHFSEHLTVWLQVCHLIIVHSFAGNCVSVCAWAVPVWCSLSHRCRQAQCVCVHNIMLSLSVFLFLWTFCKWVKCLKFWSKWCRNWAVCTAQYTHFHFSCHVIFSCHDVVSQLIVLPFAAMASSSTAFISAFPSSARLQQMRNNI